MITRKHEEPTTADCIIDKFMSNDLAAKYGLIFDSDPNNTRLSNDVSFYYQQFKKRCYKTSPNEFYVFLAAFVVAFLSLAFFIVCCFRTCISK
jgi:hypothetical protein